MIDKKTNFGKILSKFRKRAGLSQNELAQLIEMSPSHLSKIEQGNRNPLRKKNLTKIINVLGLNEQEAKELFSTAGYSFPQFKNSLTYSYPLGNHQTVDLHGYLKKAKLQDNPAINQLIETLNDSSLNETEKKEIEDKIISFINWIKEEIRKKR